MHLNHLIRLQLLIGGWVLSRFCVSAVINVGKGPVAEGGYSS